MPKKSPARLALENAYLAAIKSVPADAAIKKTLLAEMKTKTDAELRNELQSFSASAVAQSVTPPKVQAQIRASIKRAAGQTATQRTSTKRTSTKRTSTKRSTTRTTATGARRSVKIPENLRKRAHALQRAIAAGRVVARQGKTSPSAFPLQDATDRYRAFVNLYGGERTSAKRTSAKRASAKRISVKVRYQSIKGQKYPYMLKKGYRVPSRVVGGGGRGPGVIVRVPGSSAPAFSTLSSDEQRRVAAFLNADGKALRAKGAPKMVDLQGMRKVTAQATAKRATKRASTKRASTKRASANRK